MESESAGHFVAGNPNRWTSPLLHTGLTRPSPSGKPSNNEPIKPPSSRSCYNSQLIFRNNSYRKSNESPLTFTRIPLKPTGSSPTCTAPYCGTGCAGSRRDLETHLPGAHLLTIHDLLRTRRLYLLGSDLRTLPGSLLRTGTTDGNFENRGWFSSGIEGFPAGSIWLVARAVRACGLLCIELYSGSVMIEKRIYVS